MLSVNRYNVSFVILGTVCCDVYMYFIAQYTKVKVQTSQQTGYQREERKR